MNNITITKYTFLAALILATPLLKAQNDSTSYDNKLSIPFSGEGERHLKVHLMNGGITVVGYEGSEVIVEAKNADFRPIENETEDGMRLIGVPTTGLYAEEKNNRIEIGSKNMQKEIELKIQVPFGVSINLSCMNNGDIEVENVQGEIEIENLNGEISVTDSSGVVLANALNGDITISLNEVYPDKPMSFTSLNGDIDVSMPADTAANLEMKTFQGDIRSNFEIEMQAAEEEPTVTGQGRGRGRYRVEFETGSRGTINGGGPQFVFSTHNGDIRIRKIESEPEE